MVHSYSSEARARRRERALQRGYLRPISEGWRHVAVRAELVAVARPVLSSLALHRFHDEMVGQAHHNGRQAAEAAFDAGCISHEELVRSRAVHQAGGRAKHRVSAGASACRSSSANRLADSPLPAALPVGGATPVNALSPIVVRKLALADSPVGTGPGLVQIGHDAKKSDELIQRIIKSQANLFLRIRAQEEKLAVLKEYVGGLPSAERVSSVIKSVVAEAITNSITAALPTIIGGAAECAAKLDVVCAERVDGLIGRVRSDLQEELRSLRTDIDMQRAMPLSRPAEQEEVCEIKAAPAPFVGGATCSGLRRGPRRYHFVLSPVQPQPRPRPVELPTRANPIDYSKFENISDSGGEEEEGNAEGRQLDEFREWVMNWDDDSFTEPDDMP